MKVLVATEKPFAAPAVAGAVLSIGTFRSTLLIDIVTAVIGIGLLSCILLPKQEVPNENVCVFLFFCFSETAFL